MERIEEPISPRDAFFQLTHSLTQRTKYGESLPEPIKRSIDHAISSRFQVLRDHLVDDEAVDHMTSKDWDGVSGLDMYRTLMKVVSESGYLNLLYKRNMAAA